MCHPSRHQAACLLFALFPFVWFLQHACYGVQVRSLMKLYVDIEFTDRSNQFYEKFSTRANVGLLLEMLWNMPAHRYLLCVFPNHTCTDGTSRGIARRETWNIQRYGTYRGMAHTEISRNIQTPVESWCPCLCALQNLEVASGDLCLEPYPVLSCQTED